MSSPLTIGDDFGICIHLSNNIFRSSIDLSSSNFMHLSYGVYWKFSVIYCYMVYIVFCVFVLCCPCVFKVFDI